MKTFQSLIEETLHAEDLDEVEAAADLFQFGIEKGYYTKRQADEFNAVYWKVKDKKLSYIIADRVTGNLLDVMDIVKNAPYSVKNDTNDLINYVNGRFKALKGKITGLR